MTVLELDAPNCAADDTARYVSMPVRRDEMASGVLFALRRLDGTPKSSVSLLSGFSYAELDELGGFSE